MKRILTFFAVLAGLAGLANAQDKAIDLNDFSLSKEEARIETHLHVAFPMYFGWSTLTNLNYKGAWNYAIDAPATVNSSPFLDTRTGKNFVYGLEMAALHFSKPDGMLDVSLGLRWTFMDFTLANSALTFRNNLPISYNGNGSVFMPYPIKAEATNYDGRKSKIHATYLGIPLRLTLDCGKVKVFAGASAEYLISGYTKYKFPKYRQDATPMFNRFRATVEAGVQYGILGFYANYGLTTLFPDSLSDARTLTFGIVLGR